MSQKGSKTTAECLPIAEYLRLLDCLRRDKKYILELYCVLGFAMGLRASDVLSLKWDDVLNKEYLIKIEKKTKKTREIKIAEPVSNRIGQLYGLLGQPDLESFAILNKRTGCQYSIWTINRKIKEFQFKYKINIRLFSTHSFRKTFGRYVYDLFDNKTDALIKLQDTFHHTNSQTTIRYIGLVQEEIDQIYDSIVI